MREPNVLTMQQKCLNYLSNYLKQICHLEDDRLSSNMLKNSPLFFLCQIWEVEHQLSKSQLDHLLNMKYSLSNLINVCQIQESPISQFLQQYQRQAQYLKHILYETVQNNEDKILKN